MKAANWVRTSDGQGSSTFAVASLASSSSVWGEPRPGIPRGKLSRKIEPNLISFPGREFLALVTFHEKIENVPFEGGMVKYAVKDLTRHDDDLHSRTFFSLAHAKILHFANVAKVFLPVEEAFEGFKACLLSKVERQKNLTTIPSRSRTQMSRRRCKWSCRGRRFFWRRRMRRRRGSPACDRRNSRAFCTSHLGPSFWKITTKKMRKEWQQLLTNLSYLGTDFAVANVPHRSCRVHYGLAKRRGRGQPLLNRIFQPQRERKPRSAFDFHEFFALSKEMHLV